MDKFTLIDKDRSSIKVFDRLEDITKPSPAIAATQIYYGCVY